VAFLLDGDSEFGAECAPNRDRLPQVAHSSFGPDGKSRLGIARQGVKICS
jgi:hypothetical protein